jgi:hypothetical protein
MASFNYHNTRGVTGGQREPRAPEALNVVVDGARL